jgi:hypothetical protein
MQAPFNLDKYEYQTGGYFDAFKRKRCDAPTFI